MSDDGSLPTPDDRIKLTAWVRKAFRQRLRQFCLTHGDAFDMQDVLRMLVAKFLAEMESGKPSSFSREVFGVLLPAPDKAREADVIPMKGKRRKRRHS